MAVERVWLKAIVQANGCGKQILIFEHRTAAEYNQPVMVEKKLYLPLIWS